MMWLSRLRNLAFGRASGRWQERRRLGMRLVLEQLEDRLVPSSFAANTVTELIADINAANQASGSNTITLRAGNTFSLTAVNHTTDGPTGLPVITANDNLTVVGNGDTIERSTASGVPAFRLLDVAAGATLTLENLSVQGGLADGGGSMCNHGSLTLNGVTVQNNTAQGGAGGGIWSNGALTLEGGTTVKNNQALGGAGATGLGGGVFIAGGSANLTNSIVASNTAQGGRGRVNLKTPTADGPGGNGIGGGVYVAGGIVTLNYDTFASNTAQGGQGSARAGGGEGLGTARK
jgi:hypothetical protein